MSSTGTTISRSSSLGLPASAIRHLRFGPTRNWATRSSGRWVADSPILWGSMPAASSASREPEATDRPALPDAGAAGLLVLTSLESRSSVSARWAPRFDWATAWISSTITASTPVRISRTAEVIIKYSDSGVVIRMSGGLRRIAWRSFWGVSPVRRPTAMSTPMPVSGARRLRSMS